DGESLIASFGAARLPMAWDVTTGQPLPSEGTSRPRDSRLSPDGRLRVQTGSWDDPVRLVDAASGHQVAELPTGDEVIFRAVAFSPDGKRLAGGGYFEEAGALMVWDVANGRRLFDVVVRDSVWAVAFSPDGQRLAYGTSLGCAEIRDARTGEAMLALHGHEGSTDAVAFSP